MNSFNPPVRTLMGPGPSDVHPRVLLAMAKPTIGHLDPEFIKLLDLIRLSLQKTFLTKNEITFLVSGPGSLGMETCFANLIERSNTKVLVCVNGFFGGRMKETAERCGGEIIAVEDEWGKPVDLNKVEDALKVNPGVKVLAFVHAETSTGVLNDAKSLASLAKKYNCLSIADAVTSLGCVPVKIDEWGIDAVYSCSQKGLSCPPGLSPVSFSKRAVEYINKRKSKVQNWFLDVNLVMQYWSGEKRAYHHTAPANAYYGMYEALNILLDEGLENSWKRHFENHLKLKKGLESIGLEFLVDEKYRIPHLNAIKIPEGVDDLSVRKKLLNEFNLEIGSGLGPLAGKIWRIGLMGYSSNFKNITYCISALQQVLNK
jgi:alanine-glyoxylate transaminase / serine-glyoxylate transaminase / serine-pyruvate transaminase